MLVTSKSASMSRFVIVVEIVMSLQAAGLSEPARRPFVGARPYLFAEAREGCSSSWPM
jgi:hypothetical protein